MGSNICSTHVQYGSSFGGVASTPVPPASRWMTGMTREGAPEMRSYDDIIDVRRGLVAGQEAPEQFMWRDRLWVVREVVSHWVETGAWWEQAGVAALLGAGSPDLPPAGPRFVAELLRERDVWRVEAGQGRLTGHTGIFDLAFDWADTRWRLVGCVD